MSDEVGQRSDEQIAKSVYPGKEEGAGAAEEPQKKEGEPKPERRSMEEIAAVVYPEKCEQFQDIGEDGREKEDIIRDTAGLILHRGQYNGDVKALVRYNAQQLNNAVLSELNFSRGLSNARMQKADLRGSSFMELQDSDIQLADCRGTTFKSLRGCDLRGVQMDETTDLTNCDLTGAKYVLAEIQKAKGWRSCKGLRMDADK